MTWTRAKEIECYNTSELAGNGTKIEAEVQVRTSIPFADVSYNKFAEEVCTGWLWYVMRV